MQRAAEGAFLEAAGCHEHIGGYVDVCCPWPAPQSSLRTGEASVHSHNAPGAGNILEESPAELGPLSSAASRLSTTQGLF